MSGQNTFVPGIYADATAPQHSILALRCVGRWLGSRGLMSLPGSQTLITAGSTISTLTGFGSGGVLSGLLGAALGLGAAECEAKRYSGPTHAGKVLLSVYCDKFGWVANAKDIVEVTGGRFLAARSEARATALRQ